MLCKLSFQGHDYRLKANSAYCLGTFAITAASLFSVFKHQQLRLHLCGPVKCFIMWVLPCSNPMHFFFLLEAAHSKVNKICIKDHCISHVCTLFCSIASANLFWFMPVWNKGMQPSLYQTVAGTWSCSDCMNHLALITADIILWSASVSGFNRNGCRFH